MLTDPVKQYVHPLAYGDSVKTINLLILPALKVILKLRTYSVPVVKKAIALYKDVIHRYLDEYKFANGFLTVSIENNKLYTLAQGDLEKIAPTSGEVRLNFS